MFNVFARSAADVDDLLYLTCLHPEVFCVVSMPQFCGQVGRVEPTYANKLDRNKIFSIKRLAHSH